MVYIMDKKLRFIRVPLSTDLKIKPFQAYLLGILASLADNANKVDYSIADIAAKAGTFHITVTKALKELDNLKIIKIKKRNGLSSIIKLKYLATTEFMKHSKKLKQGKAYHKYTK